MQRLSHASRVESRNCLEQMYANDSGVVAPSLLTFGTSNDPSGTEQEVCVLPPAHHARTIFMIFPYVSGINIIVGAFYNAGVIDSAPQGSVGAECARMPRLRVASAVIVTNLLG
jgi:hypothetical protein